MSIRTETDIANMAADFLDASPIGSIEDQIGDAPVYKRNYREAAETVLSEFTWNGATARAELVPITAGLPEIDCTDFQNCYAWPSECLSPISVNGRPIHDLRWANETLENLDQHGNVISRQRVLWLDFTGPVLLKYTTMVRAGDMSAHCAKAVALELAIRCCTKLANSTSKMQELQVMYAEATKGSTRRVGGYQVDSRQNNQRIGRQPISRAARARAGGGV